jgi:hypothetical protein
MSSTIYIIYNAKGSFTGKLNYAYRKLTTPASSCAACDLTHGGLRLTETAAWTATKQQIGAVVRQLHIDELDSEVRLLFPRAYGRLLSDWNPCRLSITRLPTLYDIQWF